MNAPPVFNPFDLSFTRVSDYYLGELRKGTAKPVDAYVEAFPHLAEEIREHFPTMALLELNVQRTGQTAPLPQDFTLGGCVVRKEIGRGAMGVVYLAHQTELDRLVALKVIPLVGGGSSLVVERFERERRAMARLDHPHIVPVYEYGHDDRHAYLVMKLIEGRSLDQLVADRPDYRSQALLTELHADWGRFARLGAQVASGLQHAHDRGMVHRDIKPANLMLDGAGNAWITDFGLAKLFDYAQSATRTGCAIGTPRYMAPEQLLGACDPRSDVYSLGVTLYELAAGRRAWSEVPIDRLATGRHSGELVDPREANPEVPKDLAAVIMRACAFAPEARYQSARELECVLQRVSEGRSPGDRRRKGRISDEAYQRRLRWMNRLTLAAGLAAFVGGTAWLTLRPEPVAATVASASAQRRPAEYVDPRLRTEPPPAPPSKARAPADRRAGVAVELTPPRTTSDLVEKLANPDEGGDAATIVKGFLRDIVSQVDNSENIRREDKANYAQQTESVLQRLESDDVADLSFRELIDGYRQTSLPVATRVVQRLDIVQRSGLSDEEKQRATRTVHEFSTAIVNHHIPEAEASQMVDALTGGRGLSSEELAEVEAPDATVRAWLAMLERRNAALPESARRAPAQVGRELGRAVEHALDQRQ